MRLSQITFLGERKHDDPTNEVAPIVAQEQTKVGDGGTSGGLIAGRQLTADIAVGLRNKNWMDLAKCRSMPTEQTGMGYGRRSGSARFAP